MRTRLERWAERAGSAPLGRLAVALGLGVLLATMSGTDRRDRGGPLPEGSLESDESFLDDRGESWHVVAANDTLGGIAARYRIGLEDLRDANRELAEDPRALEIGARVRLPLGR